MRATAFTQPYTLQLPFSRNASYCSFSYTDNLGRISALTSSKLRPVHTINVLRVKVPGEGPALLYKVWQTTAPLLFSGHMCCKRRPYRCVWHSPNVVPCA